MESTVRLSNNATAVLSHICSRWRTSKWHADQGDPRYRDDYGVFAYYSDEELGELTGLHRTTVCRIREKLTQAGLIRAVYTGRGLKYYLPDPRQVDLLVPHRPFQNSAEQSSVHDAPSALQQMSQNATAAEAFCYTSNTYKNNRKSRSSLLTGMTVSEEDYVYGMKGGDGIGWQEPTP